jgi:hypothetical protein
VVQGSNNPELERQLRHEIRRRIVNATEREWHDADWHGAARKTRRIGKDAWDMTRYASGEEPMVGDVLRCSKGERTLVMLVHSMQGLVLVVR